MIVSPHLSGGGAENCGVIWANGFADKGHDVLMQTDIYSERVYKCLDNVQIEALFPLVFFSKTDKWCKAIYYIRRTIKCWKPDVIIGVMAACSFAAKIASIGYSVPVIMTEHSAFERPKDAKFSIKEYFFKFYLNKIYDCVTVITQRDKDVIGGRLKKVIVMPNPLSIHPLGIRPEKKKVVLAAGRLDGWYVKGFDVLIEAWHKTSKKHPNWKLLIAGTGKQDSFAFLKEKIRSLEVQSSVTLLGIVKDMGSLYKTADVFVLSSRYEGFGLVLIEAMSQGCACVACDFKGRQEEIFGKGLNGILCSPNNVDELFVALDNLLSDNEMRRILGANAIERSKCYTITNIIQRWERMLGNIVCYL